MQETVHSLHRRIRQTPQLIEGGQEPTELVNTLSQLQAEAGEKTSVSYTTTIDGRKVTFTITLK